MWLHVRIRLSFEPVKHGHPTRLKWKKYKKWKK